MSIASINTDFPLNVPDITTRYQETPSTPRSAIFGDLVEAAINLYNNTNQLQVDRDIAQIDFITGRDDNMLTVLLAQEKAYNSLNFTVQITNKIIESYREIMRMQV